MLLAALLSALLSVHGHAANFFQVKSGPVNDGGTWGNTSPGTPGTDFPFTGDNWTATSSVTFPDNYSASYGSVSVRGSGTQAAHPQIIVGYGDTIGLGFGGFALNTQTGSGFADLIMSSGSVLNMNGYNLTLGAGGTSHNGVHFLGNSGGHVTVHGAGGGIKQGTQGGFNAIQSTWTLVDFDSMSATDLSYILSGDYFGASSITWINSAQLREPQVGSTAPQWRFMENSDFRSPTVQTFFRISGSQTNVPLGRNDFTHNTVSSASIFSAGLVLEIDAFGVNVSSNFFHNARVQHVGAFGLSGNWVGNVFASTMAVNSCNLSVWAGTTTIDGNYWYSECDNSHYWSRIGTSTISNFVQETNVVGAITDDGDTLLEPATVGFASGTIRNGIGIGTRGTSMMLSLQGGSGFTDFSTMEHNTVFYDSATAVIHAGFRVGETYPGRTNMFPSVRCNLVVEITTDSIGHILTDISGSSTTQKISTADYNGYWNVGSDLYHSSGTYGGHDVTGNPNFVDSTRNFAKWDRANGGNGTSESAIRNALKMNGYGGTFNSLYAPDKLVAYVQAGFVPTNPVYKGACYDGTDIGAFSVSPTAALFFGAGP